MAQAAVAVDWRGDAVRRRVLAAAEKGIDDTMAASVNTGKQNHAGWQNRTGIAEGSIRIIEPARPEGAGAMGRWGSMGVAYFIFLELKYGAALRHSADVNYPSLARRIRKHLNAI